MTTNDTFTYNSPFGHKYYNCYFKPGRFSNNKTLFLEIESDEEGPIAHCNLNCGLPDDRICIKNYSENEGMDLTLMDLGILDRLVDHFQTGYVNAPIYTLSESGKELFKGV